MGGLQKGGTLPGKDTSRKCVKELCTGLAGKKQCLSSCSYVDNTALKDVYTLPIFLPKRRCGFSQLNFSVSSSRTGEPTLFFHSYQRKKVLPSLVAIWTFCPWFDGKQEFTLATWSLRAGKCFCTMQDSQHQTGMGGDRLAGLKEEKSCTPNLSSI